MRKTIIFLVMLAMIPVASPLGIAPGSQEFLFEPGASRTLEFMIVNTNAAPKTVSIGFEGDLSEYFDAEINHTEFELGQKSRNFKVNLEMPEELRPGPHEAFLVLTESPGSGQIAASVSVKSRIRIMVPYPGKYVRARFIKTHLEPGKTGNIIIEADNLGTETIERAEARVTIANSTLRSDAKRIPSQEEIYFSLQYTPRMHPGSYVANGFIVYNGGEVRIIRGYEVGTHRIEVLGVEVVEFGEQAVLSLELFNNWNQEVGEVYAEVEFVQGKESFGGSSTVITSFAPYETKKLRASWDKAEPGNYNITISTHFDGKEATTVIPAVLTKDGLYISSKPVEPGKTNQILWIAIITILAFLIVRKAISIHSEEK